MTIVLHHGILGFNVSVGPVRLNYFHKIDRVLEAAGHNVLNARVHPTASIARRAGELKRQIERHTRANADERVVILAHSMGGLDARHMIAHLGMADRVATLVTLSTPHRGSPYADYLLRNLSRLNVPKFAEQIGVDLNGLADLTTTACARFNERTPDDGRVNYFSVTASQDFHRVIPTLMHAHQHIAQCEGANDGLVSVTSGTWGEHLGTWPVDHLHMINKHFPLTKANEVTGRYLDLVERVRDLATDGARMHTDG